MRERACVQTRPRSALVCVCVCVCGGVCVVVLVLVEVVLGGESGTLARTGREEKKPARGTSCVT